MESIVGVVALVILCNDYALISRDRERAFEVLRKAGGSIGDTRRQLPEKAGELGSCGPDDASAVRRQGCFAGPIDDVRFTLAL